MHRTLLQSAAASQAERCLSTLTLAFAGDPPCRWAWPDPQQYLEAFPHFARAFGGGAFDHDSVDFVGDFAGVALWLPAGATPDESAVIRVIQETVSDPRRNIMFAMFEQMDSFHPREPHWHLPLVGVDPAHQRKGIGAALLRRTLAICDEQKTPAYLEATSQRNIALYQRHGFKALGRIQVADAPPIVPMRREPQ